MWLSGLLLVHTYFIYPAILTVVSKISKAESNDLPSELPTVTLVIAAYNEEDVIEEKIKNSLNLSYPDEKLEIVVFSDESSDRTDELVKSYADEGVELIRVEGRVGKTECQNIVAEQTDTEILVFSDANSLYDSSAVLELIRDFEPGTGCVVGELRYRSGGVKGESTYWRYERYLKQLESIFGSTVTANGSIYAVRKSAYVPLPREAISDFAEPLALVRQGWRVTYSSNAVAWEQTGDSVTSELSRRTRIGTRSWNTLADNTSLLDPIRYPLFSFKLVSHKLLRWLSPVFMLIVLVSSSVLALLILTPLYLLLLGFQIMFYSCAVVGALGNRFGHQMPAMFHVPYYFVISNYGMARALSNFVHHQNIVTWETEERSLNE